MAALQRALLCRCHSPTDFLSSDLLERYPSVGIFFIPKYTEIGRGTNIYAASTDRTMRIFFNADRNFCPVGIVQDEAKASIERGSEKCFFCTIFHVCSYRIFCSLQCNASHKI